MLNGLMSWAVLTDADGVVSEDPDVRQLHDGTESNRWLEVVGENEEGRAERTELGDGQAVHDGAHGMFSDSEVKISASVAAPTSRRSHEIASPLERQRCEARRSQVSRTAQHPRNVLGNLIEALGGRLPSRHPLGVGRELLQRTVPAFRKSLVQDVPEVRSLGRILLGIALKHNIPIFSGHTSSVGHLLLEMLLHPLRYDELFG
mmetsp:Transcript_1108/g.2425  ORF Transcript_1108/g.2425 Transcript_1108/m.2425 type:complete len:204 (-) Transcript_1108:1046-1657(-)